MKPAPPVTEDEAMHGFLSRGIGVSSRGGSRPIPLAGGLAVAHPAAKAIRRGFGQRLIFRRAPFISSPL